MLPISVESSSTATLDIASLTEAAAIAAARFRGRGNEAAADGAAALAMRETLATLPASGRIVVGEGEEAEADCLYNGETLGAGGKGNPEVDIAVDPLEGTTLCAKALPNAMSVIAIAARGHLLKVPTIYMEKIAVGPGFEPGLVDLDAGPAENLKRLADAKGTPVSAVTVCVLDRPRHAKLVEKIRECGAAIRLIGDGDIAGVIHTTAPRQTGIDIYMGIGGAPEGVLAAAALTCIGGQMQARLHVNSEQHRDLARRAGLDNLKRKFDLEDMASGDVSFAATGITSGTFLEGVRFGKRSTTTHSVVMRSKTRSIRWIRTERMMANEPETRTNPGRIG